MIFEQMKQCGHENVLFCQDRDSGLRAAIAIHNTALGPALGGCRRWHYESEEAAIQDVLRLSEAMTYKAAAGDLPMGGAKSVIWKSGPDVKPTEAEARAMGRFVDRLKGLYIAAEDVGVDTHFIDWMAKETNHVMGGETVARGGDPAPYTALGVISGMRGALKHQGKSTSLEGVTIAVQGVGALGYNVCRLAAEEGATLIVADINKDRVNRAVDEFGAVVSDPSGIIMTECNILCPCALGQVVNANNISSLKCDILAPGANNVLDDPDEDSALLSGKGVIYCPDFVNNGGGLLQLAGLWCGFSDSELDERIRNIENVIAEILDESTSLGSAHAAAMAYAKRRLDAGRPLKFTGDANGKATIKTQTKTAQGSA